MRALFVPLLLIACAGTPETHVAAPELVDPLPSWATGPSKDAIVAFVQAVSTPGPYYVDPAERVAVFDHDGTLWPEQPNYIQAEFANSRVRAMAPDHPEWQTEQPFAGVLSGDQAAVGATGMDGYVAITRAIHAGLTVDAFDRQVSDWLAGARHPRFDRPYTDLAYQPMLELLDYLEANAFRTWIVSGGGEEYMRAFCPEMYGVPPERIIGTTVAKVYEVRDGVPVIVQLPEVTLVDKEAKVAAIEDAIGRRPLAAFGNSDGDRAMLEWTTAGTGLRLGALVHHTDDVREWAYDRASPVGRLDKALAQAETEGWIVIDMKSEWTRVFAFDAPR